MDYLNIKILIYSFACILIFLFCSIRAIKGFNLWRKGQIVDAEIIGYRYIKIPWYQKISSQFDNMGFFPVVAFKQNDKQQQVTLKKETLLKPRGHKVRIRVVDQRYISIYAWTFDLLFVLLVLPFLLITLSFIPLIFFEHTETLEIIALSLTPALLAFFSLFALSEFFHAKSLQSYKALFWTRRLHKQKNIPKIDQKTARALETKELVSPEDVLAYKNCDANIKKYLIKSALPTILLVAAVIYFCI